MSGVCVRCDLELTRADRGGLIITPFGRAHRHCPRVISRGGRPEPDTQPAPGGGLTVTVATRVGRCPACGRRISVGQAVTPTGYGLAHSSCARVVAAAVRAGAVFTPKDRRPATTI